MKCYSIPILYCINYYSEYYSGSNRHIRSSSLCQWLMFRAILRDVYNKAHSLKMPECDSLIFAGKTGYLQVRRVDI